MVRQGHDTLHPAEPGTVFCPRIYQGEAIEAVRCAHLDRGLQRLLIVLPTGTGKTVVFCLLAWRRRGPGRRTVILVHREELVRQTFDKLAQIAPGLRIGIVKAERDEWAGADVVIASVQTVAQPHRLAPLIGATTVIVDEAHHATARTYRDVLQALGAFTPGGPLVVGLTATAGERADKVAHGAIWQEIVYQRGILQMIVNGYLIDVRAKYIRTDADLQHVSTREGDFRPGALGAALGDSGAIEAAALAYVEHGADRRGVAFTPTVATAEELADHLTRLGVPAEFVSGMTPGDERRAILGRLRSGETQVVANCGVLTEGFDLPALSCALIARPTKSQTLFVQMVGRVLRPHPTKTDALVLTMTAPPEAGLATLSDLGGIHPDEKLDVAEGESLLEAVVRAQTFGGRRATGSLTATEVNLFARSGLRWIPAGQGYALPCGRGRTVLLTPTGDDQWRVIEARRGEPARTVADRLDLELAQGLGEEIGRTWGGAVARADAEWRDRPVTDAQRTALARMRIPAPLTCGQASDAIAASNAEWLMSQVERRCA